MATIKIKRSTDANAVGPDTNAGELSANLTDKKLFIGTGGSGVITFNDAAAVTQEISSAIGGLASAFEYKGTIDASSGTQGSPTEIDTTKYSSGTEGTGDYWKVSNAGYLVDTNGGTGFYVNANDGIVFNGTDWDVIDNTNSTVASSGASITVSGSADSGYNVEVASVDGGTF